MKKIFMIAAVLSVCVALLAGCSVPQYNIGYVTENGSVNDKAVNQAIWGAINAYAKEQQKTAQNYSPENIEVMGRLKALDEAGAGGSQIIIVPGSQYGQAMFYAQDKFTDAKFIMLDDTPHNDNEERIGTNVACIGINYAQAGYIAGWAAVKDGYKKLGVMGDAANDKSAAYCYGFIRGAEAASAGAVSVKCQFDELESYKYADSTDLAFIAVENSREIIIAAGEKVKVIGTDYSHRYESDNVIASVMPDYQAVLFPLLRAAYALGDKQWSDYAAKETAMSTAENAVTFAMTVKREDKENPFDRFTTFDKQAYDELYTTVKDAEGLNTFDTDRADGLTAEEIRGDMKNITVS